VEKSQKVVWSEGMFLTPHHFQQWDRYYESLLSDRLQSLSLYSWGIQKLDIDPDSLSNGNFTLLSFQGILPDGMVIIAPEEDILPESRPIGQAFSPSFDHLDIFLGIPVERSGAVNCQLDDTAVTRLPRFKVEYLKVPDYNTGDNIREVTVVRKNLKIFLSGETTADYQSIKIAELLRTPAGNFALRENYIPPALKISASPFLTKLSRGLLEVLFAKSASLAGIQRSALEGGGVDVAKFMILHTVNAHIPLLAHFVQDGRVHPEALYLVLAKMAGALTTFSPDFQAKELPSYSHLDLSKTFRELDLKIRGMIEGLTPNEYVLIPLETSRQNVWTGKITDEKLLTTSQFYLTVSGILGEDAIRESVPRRLKAGAPAELDLIVSTAMPGVRLYFTPKPPATLPVKKGYQYFRLEKSGEFWNSIVKSRAVSFYVPADLGGLKLELIANKD
jgi:type VI secretion system protein ImpJ